MKKRISGFAALLACVALLLTLPATALSLGEPIGGYAAALVQGAELARGVYWTGGDYRTENYIERAPASGVYPIAAGWDTLSSRGSLFEMAERLEAEGKHVLAGVNGDFFNMRSGVPVGVVIENGLLRASCDGLAAVGFLPDGSTVIGRPALEMRLEVGGTEYPVTALNKPRSAAFALYTDEYAPTTMNEGAGRDYICTVSDELKTRCDVVLTVEDCLESDGPVTIPEGKLVLSLSGDANEWMRAAADGIEPGAALTLRIDCAPGWDEVDSAVGCLYKLVTEGKIEEKLERSLSPRTAVGVKADGTLVLYTVDGRQSGLSVGASLEQVASRMLELGCVEAGALDGGASTSLCAVRPGESSLTQINSPSEGSARDAANFVLLVTEDAPTGYAERLTLYPLDGLQMLVGARAPVTVKASDENGYPVQIPLSIKPEVTVGVGSVRSGVFFAERAGDGTITAAFGGLPKASIPVRVVESPDKLTVYGERYGREVKSLTLEPGQEVDLRAVAEHGHVKLLATDECFTWTLDPKAGEVDDTGHLTASATGGSGLLTVSAGDTYVEIEITVPRPIPFADVTKDDPYYEAVCYAYKNELFNGVDDDRFAPLKTMNRAMIVTVLWRVSGTPAPAASARFADVQPDSWYGEAVAWAAESGVVEGVSETEFRPIGDLTREQITAMLCRYDRLLHGETAGGGAFDGFPDAETVSAWAAESVAWAVGRGILTAREDGLLHPGSPATRAEVAEMLMRYLG